MFRTLLLCLLLSPLWLHGQVSMPATTRVGLDEIGMLARTLAEPSKLTEATQGYHPTALIHGRCMVGLLGSVSDAFDPIAAQAQGLLVGGRKGNIISFRVDAHDLGALAGVAGLDYMELAGKAAPSLDKVVKATRADSVHQGHYLPQAYTGKDVLIGVTDWGFDYTHPMFFDTTLSTTRIRAAWDQYRQAGPAPAGSSYGTELTTPAELFAAQSDTANIYSVHTHGTHVAGIAGGSGAGTDFRGMAFEAQFLFSSFIVDAAAVMDAFLWMQQIAQQDEKRLVVNMSWGLYHLGTLDGTSLISQVMDQLSAEGVVFVTSGGNNGNVNFHLRKEFEADTLRSRVQFYPYSAHPRMWGQSISIWGEPAGSFSAGFTITNGNNQVLQESPWYHSATQPYYLDSLLVQGNDTVFFNLTADAAHPLNGRPHFRLRIKNTNTQLQIALKAHAAEGVVHFWNVTELTNDVGNWGQAFLASQSGWSMGDRNYGIGEPACTETAIAVAAYSSESVSGAGNPIGGTIANFSSYGPTLDDRMKPDITAPGVSVASSISAYTDASYTPIQFVEFQGTTYPYARFSGTSMSSPAVAGIAALLLEAAPSLSAADLRDVIRQTARTDTHTGEIPPGGSDRWGMGKVNAYRAILHVLGLTAVPEQHGRLLQYWPNPVSDNLVVVPADMSSALLLRVVDALGREVHSEYRPSGSQLGLNCSSWPSGLYLLVLEQNGTRSTGRVVKH